MWTLTGHRIIWTNRFFNTPSYSWRHSGSWDDFHHHESPKTVSETGPFLLQQLYYPSLVLLLFQTSLVGKKLTEKRNGQRMVALASTGQAGFHWHMSTDIFHLASRTELASEKFMKATLHLKCSVFSFYLLPALPQLHRSLPIKQWILKAEGWLAW